MEDKEVARREKGVRGKRKRRGKEMEGGGGRAGRRTGVRRGARGGRRKEEDEGGNRKGKTRRRNEFILKVYDPRAPRSQ